MVRPPVCPERCSLPHLALSMFMIQGSQEGNGGPAQTVTPQHECYNRGQTGHRRGTGLLPPGSLAKFPSPSDPSRLEGEPG